MPINKTKLLINALKETVNKLHEERVDSDIMVSLTDEELQNSISFSSPLKPLVLEILKKWVNETSAKTSLGLHSYFNQKILEIQYSDIEKIFKDLKNWSLIESVVIDDMMVQITSILEKSTRADDRLMAMDKLYDDKFIKLKDEVSEIIKVQDIVNIIFTYVQNKFSVEGHQLTSRSQTVRSEIENLLKDSLISKYPGALKIIAQLRDEKGDIALPYAALYLSPEIIEGLMKNGAELSSIANEENYYFKLLRRSEVDNKNLQFLCGYEDFVNLKDVKGDTPLMTIVKNPGLDKRCEKLKLLIGAKANVNSAKVDQSVLGMAIYDERISADKLQQIKILLANGARLDPNHTSRCDYFSSESIENMKIKAETLEQHEVVNLLGEMHAQSFANESSSAAAGNRASATFEYITNVPLVAEVADGASVAHG